MKKVIMTFLVGFLICSVTSIQAETKVKPTPNQRRFVSTVPTQPTMTTSTSVINTDIKQGLVDSPKWVYPCNVLWCNVAVNHRFGWVPF